MKNKYWIIGIATIITALILWYVFKKKPDANPIIRTGGLDVNYPTPGNTNTGFPIVYMEYNPNAKKLQSVLGVDADGKIGPNTLKAWAKYNAGITQAFQIQNATQLANEIQLITSHKVNNGSVPLTNANNLIGDIYNQSVSAGLINPTQLINQGLSYIKGNPSNSGGEDVYNPDDYNPEDYNPVIDDLVINTVEPYDYSNGESDHLFDDGLA